MFGVDGCAKPQLEILLLSTEACTGAGPGVYPGSLRDCSVADVSRLVEPLVDVNEPLRHLAPWEALYQNPLHLKSLQVHKLSLQQVINVKITQLPPYFRQIDYWPQPSD